MMNHSRGILCILATMILLLATFSLLTDSAISSSLSEKITFSYNEKDKKAIAEASTVLGIPESNLQISSSAPVNLRYIGISGTQYSISDRITGKGVGLIIDESGRIYQSEEIIEKNEIARKEIYGKKTEILYEKLKNKDGSEKIYVTVCVGPLDVLQIEKKFADKHPELKLGPRAGPTKNTDMEKYWAKYPELVEAKQAHIRSLQDPVIQFAEQNGCFIKYISEYLPLIDIIIEKRLISELESLPVVVSISDNTPAKLVTCANTSVPTSRAQYAWRAGLTGKSIDVGILEWDRVDFSNPYLANGVTRSPELPIGNHATECAGFIASTHSSVKGAAYNVNLYSVNWNENIENDWKQAMEWSVGRGVDVLSASFMWDKDSQNYGYHPESSFFDMFVYIWGKTIVAAAGNVGIANPYYSTKMTDDKSILAPPPPPPGGYRYVPPPANAFNVIAVGATCDSNSTQRWDDFMAAYSCYLDNPYLPHTDRNKPEVSAVGSDGISTEPKSYYDQFGTWITRWDDRGSGTSFACPLVAAEVAIAFNKWSALMQYPAAVRSVIMASAIFDTPDNSKYDPYKVGSGTDKEGVGTINFAKVKECTDHVEAGVFPTSVMDSYSVISIPSDDGAKKHRIRAVLNWLYDGTNNGLNTHIDNDLDLEIRETYGGAILASSTSYENNYEWVDFETTITGNILLRYFWKAGSYKTSDATFGLTWVVMPIFEYTGTITPKIKGFTYSFKVPLDSSDISLTLTTNPSYSPAFPNLWDPRNRRTGGPIQNDPTWKAEIPDSKYISSYPYQVLVSPCFGQDNAKWKASVYAGAIKNNIAFKMTIRIQ